LKLSHYIVLEAKCLLDMRTAKATHLSPLAMLCCRPIVAGRIFSHNFPQKNNGWRKGVYYT